MSLIKKKVYIFMMKEQFCIHRSQAEQKNERLALLPLPYYVAQKQSHFLNNLPHTNSTFFYFRWTYLCIKNLSQWFVYSHTHIPFYKILLDCQSSGRKVVEKKGRYTAKLSGSWPEPQTELQLIASTATPCGAAIHFFLKPLNLLV